MSVQNSVLCSPYLLNSVKWNIQLSLLAQHLTLFRLPPPPPLNFLKTIESIDMKLTPLIKRREINLLQLSYLCCDVTWCHKDAILDFHGGHLGFSDFVKMLSELIFSLQICWITSLDNLYSPFCQYSSETSTKIEMKIRMDQIWPEQGSGIRLPWQQVN